MGNRMIKRSKKEVRGEETGKVWGQRKEGEKH